MNLSLLPTFKKCFNLFLMSKMSTQTKEGRRCTYNATSRRVLATNFCSGKAKRITYRECMCCSLSYPAWNALDAILSSVGCPALQYFSTPYHKRHDFLKKKKVTEHKMCVFYFLYNFCLKHFSFWEELSEIWSKMYIGHHVKYRLFC